jgi:hypothetical protein
MDLISSLVQGYENLASSDAVTELY